MKTALLTSTILFAAACGTNQPGNVEATSFGDLTYGEAEHGWFAAELDAACGPGGVTDAGIAIDRAPYLQQVTDDSALLLWTAEGLSAPTVRVTDAAGEEVLTATADIDASAPLPSGLQYIASLTDLEPYTIYCYEISDGSDTLVSATGFRTAPATGSDTPVRFVVLGDVGEQSNDQYSVLSQMEDVKADLGLVTGDIAYSSGSLDSFENNYFNVYADLIDQVPFFPASGNHDYKTADAGPFRQVYALPENGGPEGRELWYSFDYGNVHFVALDSEKIGERQAAWLDADLAATDQPWKVAFAHKPAYSSGYHGSDGGMQQYFVPVFNKHGVQLALFGHDHNYERTNPLEGVTYVVTGGGGVGTRSVGSSDFTAFSLAVEHFTYVEIDNDLLTLWAVDATGKTFDTAQIQL